MCQIVLLLFFSSSPKLLLLLRFQHSHFIARARSPNRVSLSLSFIGWMRIICIIIIIMLSFSCVSYLVLSAPSQRLFCTVLLINLPYINRPAHQCKAKFDLTRDSFARQNGVELFMRFFASFKSVDFHLHRWQSRPKLPSTPRRPRRRRSFFNDQLLIIKLQ